MREDWLGAGLASIGFWVFIAVIIAVQAWRKVTLRREAHATIRLAIEKGQTLDPQLVERLLRTGGDDLSRPAAIFIAMGLGFPAMGFFISRNDPGAFYPFVGIGALFLLMGLAFAALWALKRKSDATAKRDRFDT